MITYNYSEPILILLSSVFCFIVNIWKRFCVSYRNYKSKNLLLDTWYNITLFKFINDLKISIFGFLWRYNFEISFLLYFMIFSFYIFRKIYLASQRVVGFNLKSSSRRKKNQSNVFLIWCVHVILFVTVHRRTKFHTNIILQWLIPLLTYLYLCMAILPQIKQKLMHNLSLARKVEIMDAVVEIAQMEPGNTRYISNDISHTIFRYNLTFEIIF